MSDVNPPARRFGYDRTEGTLLGVIRHSITPVEKERSHVLRKASAITDRRDMRDPESIPVKQADGSYRVPR